MTLDIGSAVTSVPYWSAVLLTFVIVGMTVVLHYEVLLKLKNQAANWQTIQSRRKVLYLIVCILFLHIVEIWLFGLGVYSVVYFPGLGEIQGTDSFVFFDAVYLSATTYSTVGYGDLIPLGPIRFLLGSEALIGLVMITWSASFTYLEMQQYWGGKSDSRHSNQ